MKLSALVKNYLLNYKTNNINTIEICMGSYDIKNKDNIVFNKTISKSQYDQYLKKYLLNKKNTYNQTIYRYNSNYLYISDNDKTHFVKNNFMKYSNDNALLITYNKQELSYHEFSCKNKYHIIQNNIIDMIINDEISILFINNNSIKIKIKINHNIDLSLNFIHNFEIL
jgi:hypothetical protein